MDEQAEVIRKSLVVEGHADPGVWRSEGVCLAHAGFALGYAPTAAQPYVTDCSVITFDGRLDNRDDLHLLHHDAIRGEVSDAALASAA